ncbi:MAG TPA: alpha-N-arabinofuranosidase [Geminicoccaceae bacterium]|nr:alpha-N-arabinofuranosidase [Geminicoccaceae bacterium]
MKARATIHPDFTIAPIDDRLYGAFLEHLGRAIYGGIWEPGHPSADERGFRRDVLDLVRSLRVPIVRYPGGNFVSTYHWEDGVGPVEQRPVRLDLAWRTTEPNRIGTDEFADWCKAAGCEPMLAVNLGSRGMDAALGLLEYCNHPGGSRLADLRRRNGHAAPHDVRVWCLGNEMDGPWQLGQKTAYEYGRLAQQTARAMRAFDPRLELVACGSSHDEMPTYPAWEAEVLDECYESVDYISLHMYFLNYEQDYLNYIAKPVLLDRYIETIGGVIDYVKAKKRTNHRVHVCLDEWNVWYHNRREDKARCQVWDWPEAPHLLEEPYDFADLLVVGCALNSLIRHADRVKIACLAQLVNALAPIMTETGGGVWTQTIYWPFLMASRHGRGTALRVALEVPTYSTRAAEDVPWLDVAAVRDAAAGTVSLFAVNRHPSETLEFSVALAGFGPPRLLEHVRIAHPDLGAVNTADAPDRVRPEPQEGSVVEDGVLRSRLGPCSWHMLRLATATA